VTRDEFVDDWSEDCDGRLGGGIGGSPLFLGDSADPLSFCTAAASDSTVFSSFLTSSVSWRLASVTERNCRKAPMSERLANSVPIVFD
jgi:hypothetical protein